MESLIRCLGVVLFVCVCARVCPRVCVCCHFIKNANFKQNLRHFTKARLRSSRGHQHQQHCSSSSTWTQEGGEAGMYRGVGRRGGNGALAVDSQGVRVKVNLAQAKLSSSGHSSSSPAPFCVCVCVCAFVCVCVHLRMYLYLLPNRRRNVPSASAAEPHPDTPQAALERMHLGQTMDTNVGATL